MTERERDRDVTACTDSFRSLARKVRARSVRANEVDQTGPQEAQSAPRHYRGVAAYMNTKNAGPGCRAGPVPGPGPLVVGNEGHHGRRRRAAPFGPDESRLRPLPASTAREREREREREKESARLHGSCAAVITSVWIAFTYCNIECANDMCTINLYHVSSSC